MFNDEFKERYTTLPFAVYKAQSLQAVREVITHRHRETELISVTEGAAVFYVDSQRYELKKGSTLVIPPYALHRARTSEKEPTSYECICFDLDLLCDEWLTKGLETGAVSVNRSIDGDSAVAELAQEYIANAFLACKEQKAGWELIAIGSISLLFGILKENGFFVQHTEAPREVDFGKRVMEYVIANADSKITSRDVANDLYMDRSAFCRAFKKNFGCCFTDYILAYRLEKAKTFLSRTSMPITEIADRIGISDCSYFCKVFKKRNGCSPLAFRRSNPWKV